VKLFAAIACVAVAAAMSAWWLLERPRAAAADIAPAALWAATFSDTAGRPQALGRFRGRILVANFWATWCAPCRAEVPILVRAQSRWGARGVQIVGLAVDDPAAVSRFGQDFGVNYPLLVGQSDVDEIGRRLGNHRGVLPYTAVIDGEGRLLATKVGAYSESELEATLTRAAAELRR
jgi:thiol-disulfide isomerase/thioredoxin